MLFEQTHRRQQQVTEIERIGALEFGLVALVHPCHRLPPGITAVIGSLGILRYSLRYRSAHRSGER